MAEPFKLITKQEFVRKFHEIYKMGWIENKRLGNDGAVGNTMEDLLGIPENNLPIPNGAEWELKCQRKDTTSLLTLCHIEPSPRTINLVSQFLLPNYGWRHKEAGRRYPANEKSFRSTTNAVTYTDRGFKLNVNRKEERVEFIWNSKKCDKKKHGAWFRSVVNRVGAGPFEFVPYWGFNDLFLKAGTKLQNCFYVLAETKCVNKKQYFWYNYVAKLEKVNINNFIDAIENGKVEIDFDARTGHNHGTKFRIKYSDIECLYSKVERII